MEAKVGMFAKIKRMFGGSSTSESRGAQGSVRASSNDYQLYLDSLSDKARDLCSDVWLANKISLTMSEEGGRKALKASPPEAYPYLRSAREIMRAQLPNDLNKLFDEALGPNGSAAS